ncbi:MAG: hypothetical protein M0P71_00840 [Melioribacteraceae bacterium]|nr:hypothetical protein [Melioribacteraceae bacterium]
MNKNSRFLSRGILSNPVSWAVDKWVVGYYSEHPVSKDGPMVPFITELKSCNMLQIVPSSMGQCTGKSAAKSYRGTLPEDLLIFEGDKLLQRGYTDRDGLEWEDEEGIVEYSKSETRFFCTGIGGQFIPKNVEIIGTIHDVGDSKTMLKDI